MKAQTRPLKDISIPKISIGDRGREDLGKLEELANDIKQNGLIAPIALKEQGKDYYLLAGERRLEACKLLEHKTIPAIVYPEDTPPLKCLIIELSENAKRKNMTPEETSRLALKIHRLGIELEGEAKPSNNFEGWNLEKTASVLGISRSYAADFVKTGVAFEVGLEGLDKAKTADDAIKLVRKFKKDTIKKTQAKEVEKRIEKKPDERRKKELLDSYIICPPTSKEDLLENGFFEIVKDIPDNSIDLIELDSPYAQRLEKKGEQDAGAKKFSSATGAASMNEYEDIPPELFPSWCKKMYSECYRILKPARWFIVWFATEPWQEKIFQWLMDAEFKGKRIGGYWIKPIGQSMHPEINMASTVERFYYVSKGPARLNREGRNNSFNYKGCSNKSHPTERPIEMMNDIISTFVTPGSHIVVPCAGSGNTLLAACNHNCSGIGVDIVEKYKVDYTLKISSQGIGKFHSYSGGSNIQYRVWFKEEDIIKSIGSAKAPSLREAIEKIVNEYNLEVETKADGIYFRGCKLVESKEIAEAL